MKIREIVDAAKLAYEDTLRSHKGFMKTFKALTTAATCFFSSRQVRKWQGSNTAAISQTPTGTEAKDAVNTDISKRTTSGMQAELKSVLQERALAQKNQGSDNEFKDGDDSAGTKEDDEAKPVAKAKKITQQPQSTDGQPIPGDGEQLSHKAAHDKIKARPQNRRPPTRNPNRRR